jgi:protein dithiol oxidoreductase (disulfide-forming)
MKSAAALVLLAALAFPAVAAVDPVEGRDYQRINPPVPTSDPAKIVVTQFFSYQCPHCFKFEKPHAAWAATLPADVKAERAAVSIGHAGWVPAARAFYALSAMQKVPAIDDAFFGAIHRQRLGLTDDAGIAAWIAKQGIDRAEFEKMSGSFGVQLQMRRAEELSRKVRLPSVPALLVEGRYLVPVSDDGDFRDQLAVVDALIARVRRERAGPTPASP